MQQIDQMELLVGQLSHGSGRRLVYGTLAGETRVSVDTVRRWIASLCDFHLGFLVRPWYRNVSRSLRKEPKWYLRDWADLEDVGARSETFVACHLLKAVDGWNDLGLGRFELGYLRDKEKREVDFLVRHPAAGTRLTRAGGARRGWPTVCTAGPLSGHGQLRGRRHRVRHAPVGGCPVHRRRAGDGVAGRGGGHRERR